MQDLKKHQLTNRLFNIHTHKITHTETDCSNHTPVRNRLCNQACESCKAREALQRWWCPAKPNVSEPSLVYSSRSGQTDSEHWWDKQRARKHCEYWVNCCRCIWIDLLCVSVILTPISSALSWSTFIGPSGCFTVNAGTPGWTNQIRDNLNTFTSLSDEPYSLFKVILLLVWIEVIRLSF